MGTAYGVYVAQNYNVPDVKKLTNTVLVIVEHIEKNYRKPKKDDVVWFIGRGFADLSLFLFVLFHKIFNPFWSGFYFII